MVEEHIADWVLSPDEDKVAFHEFLKLLMKRRAKPGMTHWTQAELAAEVGVSERQVGDWCRGVSPPSRERVPKLLRVFRLPVGLAGDARQHRGDERLALLLQEKFDHLSRPEVEGIARPFEFPERLCAELSDRRDAIREAVGKVLHAGAGRDGNGPLAPLIANWPEHRLPPPQAEAANEEAEDLFVGLARAVAKCNATLPPWGGGDPAAGERRRRDGYSIALLLSALIWSAEAWRILPTLGAGERPSLLRVRDSRLLQAGIDAARGGRAFDLPRTLRDLPTQQHRASDWPPAEAWHLACQGSIRRGIGVDHHEEILRRLAHLFGLRMPDRRKGQTARDYEAVLADFEEDIGAEIAIRRKQHNGRSFVMAELFEQEDDPGVGDLYRYAERLSCLPVAYDGRDAHYVRGSERRILVAINNCLDEISKIP